jgi:hypothetical protein
MGETDDQQAIPARSSRVTRRPARRASRLMTAISAGLRTIRGDPT